MTLPGSCPVYFGWCLFWEAEEPWSQSCHPDEYRAAVQPSILTAFAILSRCRIVAVCVLSVWQSHLECHVVAQHSMQVVNLLTLQCIAVLYKTCSTGMRALLVQLLLPTVERAVC